MHIHNTLHRQWYIPGNSVRKAAPLKLLKRPSGLNRLNRPVLLDRLVLLDHLDMFDGHGRLDRLNLLELLDFLARFDLPRLDPLGIRPGQLWSMLRLSLSVSFVIPLELLLFMALFALLGFLELLIRLNLLNLLANRFGSFHWFRRLHLFFHLVQPRRRSSLFRLYYLCLPAWIRHRGPDDPFDRLDQLDRSDQLTLFTLLRWLDQFDQPGRLDHLAWLGYFGRLERLDRLNLLDHLDRRDSLDHLDGQLYQQSSTAQEMIARQHLDLYQGEDAVLRPDPFAPSLFLSCHDEDIFNDSRHIILEFFRSAPSARSLPPDPTGLEAEPETAAQILCSNFISSKAVGDVTKWHLLACVVFPEWETLSTQWKDLLAAEVMKVGWVDWINGVRVDWTARVTPLLAGEFDLREFGLAGHDDTSGQLTPTHLRMVATAVEHLGAEGLTDQARSDLWRFLRQHSEILCDQGALDRIQAVIGQEPEPRGYLMSLFGDQT